MTILNTETVILSSWGFNASGAIFIVIGIIFVFFFAKAIFIDDEAGIFYWLLALAAIGSGVSICSHTTKTEHIRYYVTIDDTISFQEFNDRYNIIEQKGEIYIVEDKEKD